MKKVEIDVCQYLLSHMMQYNKASKIIVEISVCELKVRGVSWVRPHLILNIKHRQSQSSYFVRPMGVSGKGKKVSLNYVITPKLPDDVKELEFYLLPNPQPFMEMKELILEQPVNFNKLNLLMGIESAISKAGTSKRAGIRLFYKKK